MNRQMRGAILSLIGMIALSSPCAAQSSTRDSAGVRIVNSTRPLWTPTTALRVSNQPRLQIGKADGEAPYLFTGLNAKRTTDVKYVVQGSPNEIRVFDAKGKYLRTIGRAGEGPGEFKESPTVAVGNGDTLIAWDPRLRRMSWFNTTSGKLLRERSLSTVNALPQDYTPGGWSLASNGTLLAAGRDTKSLNMTGKTFFTRVISIVPPNQSKMVSIGAFPSPEYSMTGRGGFVANPFQPTSSTVLRNAPFAAVVAGSGSWELRLYGADGRLEQIIRAAIQRKALTKSMVATERKRMDGVKITAFDALTLPDSAPAIANVLVDTEGRIWVERWQQTFLAKRGEAIPAVYDVIDPAGRWMGTVQVPANAGRVLSVGKDYILTAWTDDDDVPFLRVYDLVGK